VLSWGHVPWLLSPVHGLGSLTPTDSWRHPSPFSIWKPSDKGKAVITYPLLSHYVFSKPSADINPFKSFCKTRLVQEVLIKPIFHWMSGSVYPQLTIWYTQVNILTGKGNLESEQNISSSRHVFHSFIP
jgi:hypothetical protein